MIGHLLCRLAFHRWGLALTPDYPYPRVCCLRCCTQI